VAVQGVNGMAVAAAAAGILLVWSGFKGAKTTTTLRQLLSGQQPTGAKANPIQTPGAAATSPAAGSGALAGVTGPLARTGPGGTGGTLTSLAVASLWIAEGGDPAHAATAACIAMHESGGRAAVTSGNPDGGTNVGLFQLDTPGGKGAGYSIAQLQDPGLNTRVAIHGSSNGTDWSAWATAPMCGV